MKKDFVGQELNIGDTVIFIAPNYRHLVKATVIAFTEKYVRISYRNTWNYGKEGYPMELLQLPSQLVKFTA